MLFDGRIETTVRERSERDAIRAATAGRGIQRRVMTAKVNALLEFRKGVP
jgi:hypothetical protein